MRHLLLAILATTAIAAPASAALFTTDFGSQVTGYFPNDDVTFGPVALPFSLNYFGTNYTEVIVSNNGNVQFGTNSGSFSPTPLNTTTVIRAIAPYWTDLDSRDDPLGAIAPLTGGSAVYVSTPTANQIIFTWDRLGYFSRDYGGRAQFQLVLNNPDAPIAPGQAAIGFYYGLIEPQAGFPGRPVTIGFGDGLAEINPGEISLFAGTSVDVAAAINRGPGFYLFGLEGGVPTPTPAPAAIVLFGLGLAALGLGRRAR